MSWNNLWNRASEDAALIDFIRGCPKLDKLHLRINSKSEPFCEALCAAGPHITQLSLSGISGLLEENIDLLEENMVSVFFKRLKLVDFNLDFGTFTNASLDMLLRGPSAATLQACSIGALNDMSNISSAELLRFVRGCPNLHTVDFGKIGDEDLEVLRTAKQVTLSRRPPGRGIFVMNVTGVDW